MQRLLFLVAYDGRPYRGWQSQPGGSTVQDDLEAAFACIIGSPMRIHSAGRTDSGVHALGQCFHADIPSHIHIPLHKWHIALNVRLPQTIRVLGVTPVPADFHARFSALSKTYRYGIDCALVQSPFLAGITWHIPHELNLNLLRQALESFIGTHDFTAFAALRGNEPAVLPPHYFKRHISHVHLQQQNNLLLVSFTGTGFLYKMVRLMVGAAYTVCRGKLPLPRLQQLITDPASGEKSPLCAPANGLTLMQVHYPAPIDAVPCFDPLTATYSHTTPAGE